MPVDREILVMASPSLAFLIPVLTAALDYHWPTHWPVRGHVSRPDLSFPVNLLAALQRSPSIIMLVMSDHLPLLCTPSDIGYAEAAIVGGKCCSAVCTKIPHDNPRAKVFFGGDYGWQECSSFDACRVSLHPALWYADTLRRIAETFKAAKDMNPWDFELKASSQFSSLSIWRAKTVSPYETLFGGFVRKGRLLPAFVNYINNSYRLSGGA